MTRSDLFCVICWCFSYSDNIHGSDTLGSHTKPHGVILQKVTLMTCGMKGDIEEIYARNLRSSRIVHFQLRRTTHNEKLKG
jgi:hypothetical protein